MSVKKIIITMLLSMLLFLLPIMPASSLNNGVDRSRVKRPDNTVYTATLTIGTMSFDGTLERIDRVTDEQVEQAIKEVLKDKNLTDQQVGDLQRLVESVQSNEQITKEDVEAFKENLKAVTGADMAIDIVDVLTGGSGKSIEEIIKDYLSGEVDDAINDIRDQVLDELMEEGSDIPSAADTAEQVANTVVIVLDQMEKDNWKQENRVLAANAWRELQDFYYRVNKKIDDLRTSKFHGWALKIDTNAYKNLTFFKIEGNIETWTINLLMNKYDKRPADPEGPSGTYTGTVQFYVEYNLKAFDEGFAGYISTMWKHMMMLNSMAGLTETGESIPSEITRRLYHKGDLSMDIWAGKLQGAQTAEYTVFPDFSSLIDEKFIKIKRVLTLNGTQKVSSMDLKVTAKATYSAKNVEKITEHMDNYTITGKAYGKKVNQKQDFPDSNIGWDASIWEQWTKEKKLTTKVK